MSASQARDLLTDYFVGEGADPLAAMGFAPPRDARGVSELASVPRLNLILETNVRMAQECGQYRQWAEVKDYYGYGRWVCGFAEEHRPEHLRRDGRVYPFDHPIWTQSPPGGEFNCHCSRELLSAEDVEDEGLTPEPLDSDFQPSSLGFDSSRPLDYPPEFGRRVRPEFKEAAEDRIRQEQERLEAERKAKEEQERLEAERKAKEDAEHKKHRQEQLARAREGRKARIAETEESLAHLRDSVKNTLLTDGKDSEAMKLILDEYNRLSRRLSHYRGKKQASGYAEKMLKVQIAKTADDLRKQVGMAQEALANTIADAQAQGTFSGIWKNQAPTLDQYPLYEDSIPKKKEYYASHPGNDDKAGLLRDFEEKGKSWTERIEKARKELDSAEERQARFQELNGIEGDSAFSKKRKDAAKWFLEDQYAEADRYYNQYNAITKAAPQEEQKAAFRYTQGSGGFNRPLSGYEGGSWSPSNFKGVGNVDLNCEGQGENIDLLTKFINRFTLRDDCWIQRGDGSDIAYKNLLGLDMTLRQMTESERQSLIGREFVDTKFLSGGVNKNSGFKYYKTITNIYLPKGTHAAWLEPFSAYQGGSERELLLQRGMTYRITKIEYDKHKDVLYLDIEALIGIGLKFVK